MTEIIHFDGKLQDYITAREKAIDGERERLVDAFVKRYPNHIVEVIDRGMGETYTSHDNCPQCVALALIKGENK